MAFKKHMTISELLLTTILRIYDHQDQDGLISSKHKSDNQPMKMEQAEMIGQILESQNQDAF